MLGGYLDYREAFTAHSKALDSFSPHLANQRALDSEASIELGNSELKMKEEKFTNFIQPNLI